MPGQVFSTLVRADSSGYILVIKNKNDVLIDRKHFSYPVFKLRQADIDQDGQDEFVLGVRKITVLDTTVRNRINIWKLDHNRLVPMWLSSFFPHPLYDFEVHTLQHEVVVLTIEYDKDKRFLVSEYVWHSFGLKFKRYIKRNVNLAEALTLIQNPDETP